jgi:hypothetical protein
MLPSMSHPRITRGLLLRKGIWHIDKVLFGRRICESTHSSDLNEAEMLLAHRTAQARKAHLYGEPGEHTFREAGAKFLAENQHKRSIERDVRALKIAEANGFSLDQFIANAVAGAVADKVGGVGAEARSMPDSPLVAATRRPGKSVAAGLAEQNKEAGWAKCDSVMRYSRRQTLTAPRFRRAAIIRNRSSKSP